MPPLEIRNCLFAFLKLCTKAQQSGTPMLRTEHYVTLKVKLIDFGSSSVYCFSSLSFPDFPIEFVLALTPLPKATQGPPENNSLTIVLKWTVKIFLSCPEMKHAP